VPRGLLWEVLVSCRLSRNYSRVRSSCTAQSRVAHSPLPRPAPRMPQAWKLRSSFLNGKLKIRPPIVCGRLKSVVIGVS